MVGLGCPSVIDAAFIRTGVGLKCYFSSIDCYSRTHLRTAKTFIVKSDISLLTFNVIVLLLIFWVVSIGL